MMPTIASAGTFENAGKFLKKHLQLAVLDLQLQIRPDFGVDVEQRLEHRPIEPQRQHLRARADRRRARRAVQHLDVAEAVAGAQHAERDLLAALAAASRSAPGPTR